jgi:hypothetical protein
VCSNCVAKIVAAPLVLGVCLILGLGKCVPHIPLTVNAESAANESPEPDTGAEDPAAAERLKDCAPGTADCDRDHSNGCESTLADDPKNCGVCGTDCTIPNTETGCMGGTCRVIHCSPGFCDDDSDPENGCETPEKNCHPHAAGAY